MPVLTREQRTSLYKDIKKRIERHSYESGIGGNLMDAAEAAIEYYPEDEEDSTPSAEEAVNFLHEHLLLPRVLLGKDLLMKPLYPVITLRMVGTVLGFGDPEEYWLNAVNLNAADKQSKKVMSIVWLCWLLRRQPEFAQAMAKKFNDLNNEEPNALKEDKSGEKSEDASTSDDGSNQQNKTFPASPTQKETPNKPLRDDGVEKETDVKLSRDGQNNIVVTINGKKEVAYIEGEPTNHHDGTGDAARKLTAITAAFRQRLFKGFDDQSITRHLHFFEKQRNNLQLNGDHMANFFMNTLDDPALSFFQDNVRDGMSYEGIKQMMLRQYNNPSRQSQMKRELDMLRMRKVMQDEEILDPLKGLDRVMRRISELSVQVHSDFRTDRHLIGYMSNAVAEFPFALTPIQNIDAMGYSFQTFCSALQSAIRTQTQIDLIKNERKASHGMETLAVDTHVAQYARHPKSAYQLRQPSIQETATRSMSFEEARRRGVCATCSERWVRGHKCKPEAMRNNIRRRIGSGESKVNIISDLMMRMESDKVPQADAPAQTNITDEVRQLDDLLRAEPQVAEPNEGETHLTGHVMAMTSPFAVDGTPVNEMHPSETGYTFPTSFVSSETNHTSMTFSMSSEHTETPVEVRPIGFCLDIGAPRSVTGQRELNRIVKTTGIMVKVKNGSTNSFRFGNVVFRSVGTVVLQLKTPKGAEKIFVQLDIVAADMPALLGIDVMDAVGLTPCTVSNRLVKKVPTNDQRTEFKDLWSIKCIRASSNHMYAPIVTPRYIATNFTHAELTKLHKQFFHPSPSKLFNVLEKSRPENLEPKTLEALQEITKNCTTCQRIQTAPLRFRVSFGSETARFNERIMIDVMYLDGEPVLHMIDEGTHFSAAQFLPNISTQTIWTTIIQSWATIYTGLPHRIMVDQGSCFGDSFMYIGAAHNIKIERTGVEAHSSLGIGERYHQPLRTTYRKMRTDHPNADKKLTLSMAVKAMNETLGPEGLVPSLLVFGEYPEINLPGEPHQTRPSTDERAALAQTARAEMERIMAKLRIQRALRHAVPPAHSQVYDRGDQVLIWREKVVAGRIG